MEDVYEQQEVVVDTGRRFVEKESMPYNGREDGGMTSLAMERERVDKQNVGGLTSQKNYSSSFSQNAVDTEERVQKVSPPRRKAYRDEKSEKLGNWLKKDGGGSDPSATGYKQQNMSHFTSNSVGSREHEPEPPVPDGDINEILEVCDNYTLLTSHITSFPFCLIHFYPFLTI